MSELAAARIRALRAPKPAVDPWAAPEVRLDDERLPEGGSGRFLTAFLIGAECPFTCVFCDLWRHTLDEPTPAGALAEQVEAALSTLPAGDLARTGVKLYNASNFFDRRAVPEADVDAMAALLGSAPRVVVESHPKLVGAPCLAFADAIGGRLEVAMGLETVHPRALASLGKGMTLEDFDSACARLRAAGVGIRAFVLVGAPYLPAGEAARWAARSARHAFRHGAGVVSLIPVRGGNGAMEELERRREWRPPTLDDVEEAFERSLEAAAEEVGARGIVQVDTWDLGEMAERAAGGARRARRLEEANLTGALGA